MERLRVFVGERVEDIFTPEAEMKSTTPLALLLPSPLAEDASRILIHRWLLPEIGINQYPHSNAP